MRIARLEYRRFGPFTDRTLDFGNAPTGLHLVYGPNEAGKTTALRGLIQLLFGIPRNSNDNFLHPYKELRIGAALESSSGQQLEIVRRKGNSKTLRAADDSTVVDEEELRSWLGGIDEAGFRRQFGIDYHELEAGSKEILSGGGDLGEVLFAAASGMADIHRVRAALESELQGLFKPSGSNPQLNRLSRELKDIRKQIKATLLPGEQWVRADAELTAAKKRQTGLEGRLRELRKQHDHVRRLYDALPIISARTTCLEELAPLGDIPLLDDGFAERVRSVDSQLTAVAAGLEQAQNEVDLVSQRLEQLEVPAEILQAESQLEELKQAFGSYRKAAQDRKDLDVQVAEVERQIETQLKKLRHAESASDADWNISVVQRQRIMDLGTKRGELQSAVDLHRKALEKLRADIGSAESQLQQLPEVPPLEPLELALRAVERAGDLEDRLATTQAAIGQLQERAESMLKQLPLWDRPLAELESTAFPSFETVEHFREEFLEVDNARKQVASRTEELAEQLLKVDTDLAMLERKRSVPTPAELKRARDHRDLGWALVEAQLRGTTVDQQAVAEFIASVAGAEDLADAFAAAVNKVDELADQLYDEAEAVERKTTLLLQREDIQERLDNAKRKSQSLEQGYDVVSARWQDVWSPAGLTPASPAEMQGWLRKVNEVLALAHERQQHERERDELRKRVADLENQLATAIAAVDPEAPDDLSLNGLVAVARQTHDELRKLVEERHRRQDKLEEWTLEHAETQRLLDDATKDLETWKADWAEAVEVLQLNDRATPSEANAVLSAVQGLQENLNTAHGLRDRIESIDRDAEEFRARFAQLLESIAPDLAALDIDQAAPQLFDRLAEAKKLSHQQSILQQQFDTASEEVHKKHQRQLELQSQWDQLMREAQCGEDDDIYEVVRRSQQRRELERRRLELDESLRRLAESTALDEFIEDAKSTAASELQAQLETYEQEMEQLERELKETHTTVGKQQTLLAGMDSGSSAAELRENEEEKLAALRSSAEQYVRLRTELWALDRAIERYRQKGQGTVLARAGELFAELTLGSFARLQVDYDDRGQPVIVGVRPDKTTVEVGGMSDGTRDQLYLAIRLATLESYLQRHEPLPFIVDDILVMFDDDRASAAIRVLDEIAQQTQVIFFTHHEHLIELARASVRDPSTLLVHVLAEDATDAPAASTAYSS